MVIAIGNSRKSIHWKNTELEWGDLTTHLREAKRTAETMAEYNEMDKDSKGECKDVGGFVGGKIEGERRVTLMVAGFFHICLPIGIKCLKTSSYPLKNRSVGVCVGV